MTDSDKSSSNNDDKPEGLDRKVSEANPDEVVEAFKGNLSPAASARGASEKSCTDIGTTDSREISSADIGTAHPTDPPSGHPNSPLGAQIQSAEKVFGNPFSLFADVFYGVMVAPKATLTILGDANKFPPNSANFFLTVALVVLSTGLTAALKCDSSIGNLKALTYIFGNLSIWFSLASILFCLSLTVRSEKLKFGNALISTGWAFLPFIFFAPIACFKATLGDYFIFLASIPAVWFLALEWLAFQTALRMSTFRLMLVAFVVPPVFALIVLFWASFFVASTLPKILASLN